MHTSIKQTMYKLDGYICKSRLVVCSIARIGGKNILVGIFLRALPGIFAKHTPYISLNVRLYSKVECKVHELVQEQYCSNN